MQHHYRPVFVPLYLAGLDIVGTGEFGATVYLNQVQFQVMEVHWRLLEKVVPSPGTRHPRVLITPILPRTRHPRVLLNLTPILTLTAAFLP